MVDKHGTRVTKGSVLRYKIHRHVFVRVVDVRRDRLRLVWPDCGRRWTMTAEYLLKSLWSVGEAPTKVEKPAKPGGSKAAAPKKKITKRKKS